MTSILSMLDEEFAEVKDVEFKDLEAGVYTGEITQVDFKGDNKWADGTLVPQVVLRVKISEGDFKGNLAFINLNLNGRDPRTRGIALQVFASTMRRLGLDPKAYSSLEELIEATPELVGTCVEIEAVESGGYINSKILKKC